MKTESIRYFAAANSGTGFFSLFGEVFDPEKYDRIYIIKGGSGTGKSTMMKLIGEEAEKRGYGVEYVLCASDPDSLDGIVIPRISVAVIDGTAPHTTDPKYPMAVERIVDLYRCIDGDKVARRREEIISESREAARHTSAAYGFMRALKEITSEKEALARTCFDRDKAAGAAERMIRKLSRGGEYRRLFSCAVCSLGYVREEAFPGRAGEMIGIVDKFGLGYAFTAELCRAAKENGIGFTEMLSPVCPKKTEGLFFEKDGVHVTVCDENEAENYDKKINIMRFADRDKLSAVRGRLRFYEKCEDAVSSGAFGCFASARVCHEKLERIYGVATDFSRVDEAREMLIKEIFGDVLYKM